MARRSETANARKYQLINKAMKTILYIEVNNKQRDLLYSYIMKLYHFLHKYGYYTTAKNRVYDNLGLIDTLGSNVDITRFTRSYSDELTSEYAVKLPFNYNLLLIDSCGPKEIVICKNEIKIYDND
jgi:hypothetical protein